MGNYQSTPIEPKGTKSLDEWVNHIANVLAMTQDEIENLLGGRLSSLNIRELTADKIITGTLLAALVTIRANLTAGAYIRIDGNGMTINDGTKDVFAVDLNGHVTMTGALVQSSASSYPRVELNSSSTLIKAARTANDKLEIIASYLGASPGIIITQGGNPKLQIQELSGTDVLIATITGDRLQLSASGDLLLISSQNVNLEPTSNLKINGLTGFTGTFSTGTQTVTVTKGIITSVI